jgi:sugar phosphate isomerase/epimerase
MLSRRMFLGSMAAVAAAHPFMQLSAAEPFRRSGKSHLRLALAAYSFRDDLTPGKDGSPAAMNLFQFIDYCADHGCEGAELTSYYFPKDVTDAQLVEIRHYAHLRGMTVSGTAVGNDFCHPDGPVRDQQIAHVKEWIRKATLLGAPHIRVFAGTAKGTSKEEAKKRCIAALEECGEAAGKAGVFLGIENHGGIVAESADLVDILRSVRSPWVGINLDTGNFHTEDPYADLAAIAPWAVNVQYKAYIRRKGQSQDDPRDDARVFKILRDAGYQGFVALEYELKGRPQDRVPVLLKEMQPFMG